ncbi:Cupredoxin [Bisporella sp. PMI_857]|nr:Cupredoxin [Bisporella sp. PMI_857]
MNIGYVLANNHWRKHDKNFVPDAVLRITVENISQSCLPPKPVVTINGTSPGPEIRLLEGNTYWIRVYNDMPYSNLTMHWHGLAMASSPFSDGSPSASQWPIPPLHFFDYEIHPELGTAGTYLYHSHVGFQAVSATGPLIIEDRIKPYQYDEERIVYLQDVFTRNDSTVESGLISSPLQWSGETSMILVNGKGGGTANGTTCSASLSTINVEPGKAYRLRFIGGTALTFASLAFEDHDCLTVIEADGAYTKPHEISYLQVGSGQRFSVILNTKPKPEKSRYYMQVESRDRPTLTRGYAVLNYGKKSATKQLPPSKVPISSLPNQTYGFLEYALSPLYPWDIEAFPTAEEVTRRVTITVHQSVRGPTVWLSNGLPWDPSTPKEPYLISLYKGNTLEYPSMDRALANNGLDPVTDAFPAQIGEVLEIVIQNTGADREGIDIHPWHAHGAHYYDLGSGNGTYDAEVNEKKLGEWGKTPMKRDTTMLYKWANTARNGTAAGWRAWRVRVDSPGVWMIHCHILQHMLMGMQTVWVMGNDTELLGNLPEVDGYLTYGGDVYGNKKHWPRVVHFNEYWADRQ